MFGFEAGYLRSKIIFDENLRNSLGAQKELLRFHCQWKIPISAHNPFEDTFASTDDSFLMQDFQARSATHQVQVAEYKKDGGISKLRLHRGNIPILPQTKLCPHCPAKFTRTTHLNRHLHTRKDTI